jgi:hypothetical protein
MKDIKERKSPLPVAALLVCLTGISLYGCGAKTEMSKEEQANFAGGPPPPGYAAEAEKRKAAAEKNAPASYKAWQEKRNADLNHGGAPPNAPPIDSPASQ